MSPSWCRNCGAEYGSCAGNIAYNLMLLEGDPYIMPPSATTPTPYLERLDRLGLPRDHVRHVPGTFTAQAFITTDLPTTRSPPFTGGDEASRT